MFRILVNRPVGSCAAWRRLPHQKSAGREREREKGEKGEKKEERPGGILDFGLDGGVPPGLRDPNPCLEVKKVPMFGDFAQKMDPCLGIF